MKNAPVTIYRRIQSWANEILIFVGKHFSNKKEIVFKFIFFIFHFILNFIYEFLLANSEVK